MKKWIIPVVIVAAGAAGFAVYQKQHADRQPENIIASNGRLELERIDVATLDAGRVKSMIRLPAAWRRRRRANWRRKKWCSGRKRA